MFNLGLKISIAGAKTHLENEAVFFSSRNSFLSFSFGKCFAAIEKAKSKYSSDTFILFSTSINLPYITKTKVELYEVQTILSLSANKKEMTLKKGDNNVTLTRGRQQTILMYL